MPPPPTRGEEVKTRTLGTSWTWSTSKSTACSSFAIQAPERTAPGTPWRGLLLLAKLEGPPFALLWPLLAKLGLLLLLVKLWQQPLAAMS